MAASFFLPICANRSVYWILTQKQEREKNRWNESDMEFPGLFWGAKKGRENNQTMRWMLESIRRRKSSEAEDQREKILRSCYLSFLFSWYLLLTPLYLLFDVFLSLTSFFPYITQFHYRLLSFLFSFQCFVVSFHHLSMFLSSHILKLKCQN